jgi:LemA protein
MGKIGLGCLGVLVLVAVVVALSGLGTYNGLVGKREAVDSKWGDVESAYQRRADLIPNLVATVQGAAAFEQATLTAVTEARASVGRVQMNGKDLVNDPEAFARFEQAQNGLSAALQRLMVVVEKYPELKATQGFRDLQAQLEGTENRISVERMRFNEVAQDYNTTRQRFPAVLFANALGFKEKAYFKSQPGAEQAPRVQFDFGKPGAQASPTAAPAR